jgi:hypothetical protein
MRWVGADRGLDAPDAGLDRADRYAEGLDGLCPTVEVEHLESIMGVARGRAGAARGGRTVDRLGPTDASFHHLEGETTPMHVDGLEGDRWAIIGKVHHCMVDGVRAPTRCS